MTKKKPVDPNRPKLKKGFAAIPREKLMEISAMGGRACPPEKRAFNDPVLAADAGRAGARSRGAAKED
jgi:general stress protein YciG